MRLSFPLPRPAGRARLLAAALLGAPLLWSPRAEALKIMIKGTSSLDIQARPEGGKLEIRGKLRDDLGGPVPGARVEIEVAELTGKPYRNLATPQSCASPLERQFNPSAYHVDTDSQGAICLSTTWPQQGTLRARFAGRGGLGGTQVELPLGAERPPPQLSWDPRPETIDLDASQARVAVALADSGNHAETLSMELLDERGQRLATASTDERGRAHFDMPTAALGPPGVGELTVQARRQAGGALTTLKAGVVRVARVALQGEAPAEAVVPHDGLRFSLGVQTRRGAADGGVVEAKVGSETVGVGAVSKGKADVVVAFDVPSEGRIDVVFRYLPASPELRPGDALMLSVPVKPPSPLRKAPLLLAGLGLVAWLARGWKRPPSAARKSRASAPPLAPAEQLPPIEVEAEPEAQGYRGAVLDAHDRTPLAGAVVRVVARDFYGERDVGRAEADAQGRFSLAVDWDATRTLVVESPWHATLERPLPRPGRVTLALVSRRRALLGRLVEVARKLGHGPPAGAEPTPAQIARAFDGQLRAGGATWARAVESAVFGHQPPGAREEAELSAMESNLARHDASDGVRR